MSSHHDTDARTIADFGEQWQRYPGNEGFYGAPELLVDIVEPLLPIGDVRGRRVLEIGSGSGRIVRMLLAHGAAHVVAYEPSAAFEVLQRNLAGAADRVTLRRARGDEVTEDEPVDLVVSIGVLHHITDPGPAVRAAYRALRPGGRILIWVYGAEGHAAYLAAVGALRRITPHLPPPAIDAIAAAATAAADAYGWLCRVAPVPLPLAGYLEHVWGRFPIDKRRLVVYDQLNPAYARYYRQGEVEALLADAGFTAIGLHHRHGYSWTAIGERPGS